MRRKKDRGVGRKRKKEKWRRISSKGVGGKEGEGVDRSRKGSNAWGKEKEVEK